MRYSLLMGVAAMIAACVFFAVGRECERWFKVPPVAAPEVVSHSSEPPTPKAYEYVEDVFEAAAMVAADGSRPCYTAIVNHVHDGDTLIVTVPDWAPVCGRQIGVRLSGFDCAELHDANQTKAAVAERARVLVSSVIPAGSTISLREVRRDKYFRLLAEVWIKRQGVMPGEIPDADQDGFISLGVYLYRNNLAKHYNGRGPKPW